MERQKTAWYYIKGYKFNSLLFKNFIYVFVLVTLPLLLIIAINYKKFDNVVNNRVIDMNKSLLQKNAAVTDNIMLDLLDTLNEVSQINTIMEIVQETETDETYYDKVAAIIEAVNTHTMSNNLITETYIYSDINKMLIDKNGASNINEIDDKGKWYDIHKLDPMYVPYILVNHANSIYVCQPVWSPRGQRAGLFVLDVDLQKIRDLLQNQQENEQGIFFILDISGQIIYCNERGYMKWDEETIRGYGADIAGVKTGESRLITDNGKRIVSVAESMHKSWRYAFITQVPDYKEELDVVGGFLFTSITVGSLTSLIVAYLITIFTYRPIRKIIQVIQNPKLHWSEREASKQSNELLYITNNILADRGDDTESTQELSERIRSLRQAQFRALQFQIDPHFLYNTLETIKWNAVEEMGLGNKTSKMLTKVARLYRLGLENDDVIVTLKEELDFLKLYIEIVRMRFGDSIQFHWDIDESLYGSHVIKMCLQPIVENAIQHGLRPKKYLGNITVSAYCEKETLCISVEDDGQSLRQEEIEKLNKKLKTGTGFEESKVGLRNVNERIKLIYGRKYGVNIVHGRADGRVRVVLTFPCRNFNRSEETK